VIVPLSSLALACNLGSLLCAWWPWLNELFNHSGWFWMEAMIRISDWFAGLPGAYYYVAAPVWIVFAAYYALLFGTLTGWLLAPKRRVWTALTVGVMIVAGFVHYRNHRHDVRVTVLPLSGGDSIFVDASGRANDLLIDTGDTEAAALLVKPFLHAQGVNRLRQLLLTHGDVRHIGGAATLLDDFGARTVFTSSVRFRSPMYQRVARNLHLSPERLREVNRGDRFGPWTVLHPQADDQFALADDSVLVLRGEFYGARVLLCSDLGKFGQRALLERETDLRADIVVAGIPAREEPLSDALLDAVHPKAIVLSAGEYPATERVTDRLRERIGRRGIPVFCTLDDSAVTVTLRTKGWEVRAMDGEKSPSAVR
jgi:competence protein ComEC